MGSFFSKCLKPSCFRDDGSTHGGDEGDGGGGGASSSRNVGRQDGLMWYFDNDRHGYGDFSMAFAQGNRILEDQCQVEAGRFGTFAGVYDGHGGPEAARFVCDNLFHNFNRIFNAENRVTPDTIQSAFQQTEDDFTSLVSELWTTQPNIATAGSCCLVAAIYKQTLYVASLGDCRAVLGRRIGDTGEIAAMQLSVEHNASLEAVRQELQEQHPDDPGIVVLKNGAWRVKGIIQVSRSIGDVYMKQAKYNRAPIAAKFQLPQPVEGMPFMTATPSILSHPLQRNDSFIILASDGLWEHLTNEEAVQIVHRNPCAGSAQNLLEAALSEVARGHNIETAVLRRIEKNDRRPFHDDTTVIVLFLNHDLITRGFPQGPQISVRSPLDL